MKRSGYNREADPGRVAARRLNRVEYNNTIRDLLGVHLRPADEFPVDDSGYGFDNIGDVLSISPLLMEKYMAAAKKVSRVAVYGETVPLWVDRTPASNGISSLRTAAAITLRDVTTLISSSICYSRCWQLAGFSSAPARILRSK